MSGQDEGVGVGRHTVPPCTIKRGTATNLKTKNSQNCQKILTVWKSDNQGVKEETFIQTGRRGRDELPGRARQWLEDQVVPHLCADKPGGTSGEHPRVPVRGNKASKSLTGKTCGGCSHERNSQTPRRVRWRDPPGPRMYTNLPTWESAPEGPNLLVGSRGHDRKPAYSTASGIVPSLTPSPIYSATTPW